MITCKCTEKFRNKHGKIYGYRLTDLSNNSQDVTPEDLKKAIINKQVNIVNLTLTSDGRLIECKEANLKNTKIPNTSTHSQNIRNEKIFNLFNYVANHTSFELKKDTYEEYKSPDIGVCYSAKTNVKKYNGISIYLYMSYSTYHGLSICIEGTGRNRIDFEIEYETTQYKVDDACTYVNEFINLLNNASKTPKDTLKLACLLADKSGKMFEELIEDILDILTNQYGNKDCVNNLIQNNINHILRDKSTIQRIHCILKDTSPEELSSSEISNFTKYAILYEALTGKQFTDFITADLLIFDLTKFNF